MGYMVSYDRSAYIYAAIYPIYNISHTLVYIYCDMVIGHIYIYGSVQAKASFFSEKHVMDQL